MALDDDGMKNQYLTKLRVKIREDSDIMRELTEMLQDFALSYNAELNSVGNVDQYNPRAQEFLEAWEALRQDFDVWVGQIAFAGALELQAMWNNREIWPRRLARLPSMAPPREDEEQEPTPELPPLGMPGLGPVPMPAKGKGKGAPSAPPSSSSGGSMPSLISARTPDPPYNMTPMASFPIHQVRRLPHPGAVDIAEDRRGVFMRRPGFAVGQGIHGFAAAPAAEIG